MALAAIIGFGGLQAQAQDSRARRVDKAQKKRSEVETAVRANEARRSRRAQIKEARIRQSQIENISASTNQTASSAAIAAGDSLQANLGTNVGTIGTSLLTSKAKSLADSDVLDANRRSGVELVSGLALDIFSRR